jgi:hypothetical protein
VSESGLFIGFGDLKPGREAAGAKIFGEAMAYFEGLRQEGVIESYEPVMLAAHGGDLGGFVLLRGEDEKLARMVSSDEWRVLATRADYVTEHFGTVRAWLGSLAARAAEEASTLTTDLP